MTIREFRTELWLPLVPAELFPFFGDAANLGSMTPPWLNFRILTPLPITMREGTLIDYCLRVHGVSVRWRTRITAWQPPHRFVDEQVRGPYRQWVHEHTFEPHNGGTVARDLVRYAVPFDFIAYPLLVRGDVERIFAFRAKALRERFSKSGGPGRVEATT